MAAVLAEPDTAKAAVTTDGPDMVYMSLPIEKRDETKTVNPVDGTPDLLIWGKVTDGTLDSDLQMVDPDASLRWIKRWHADGRANVRMQHDPGQPVGKGIEVDGHYVKALIADPKAKHFIRTGVLNDWSIGIMNPDIRVGDPTFKHLDPQGQAIKGIITDRSDGLTGLGEISVVDRGSNYGTKFSLCKAAADGTAEWVGKLTAPADVLSKMAAPKAARTISLDLPADLKVTIKPTQLAKLATFKQRLARDQAAIQAEPAVIKAAEPDAVKAGGDDAADRALAAIISAENAALIGKSARSFSAEDRRGYAKDEVALPDGSYPMPDADAVRRAAILIRSKHGNWKAAAKLLARRVRALGIPNPLEKTPKGDSAKVAKGAAAKPQVTKCKCAGGMMAGKPCPDCKKGRKKARRMVAKALTAPPVAKKKKALCDGCGAMQSRKHANCTECGRPMAGAMPLTKNHDHMCLGCGKAPLDKGEKHCPGCGTENPGYLPVADRKIPMNADKAAKPAKERVSDDDQAAKAKKGKSGKKGKKKGNPFGDSQAPPFGSKDDAKPAKPAKAEKRKGKGKGRKPTEGVTGTPPSEGLPAHREPDGPPVEMFERSSHLQDGDEAEEMHAAMRHKSLAASGLSAADALLHDLTCPAFAPADVAKAFPHASLAQLDDATWRQKMLDDAACGPVAEAGRAILLWQHATTLKTADPQLLADLAAEQHAAFLAANESAFKAFRDATPGPGTFPTPGHGSPQQYRRPYIHDGHAAPSPMHDAPHSFSVPDGQPSAEQYTRDLITAGHAADSPSNDTPRHEPQPASMTPGRPDRVYYRGTMRDNARQAMTAMHDHISRVFPDVCPMSPELGGTQKPAPPVPVGVGGPAPHSAKAARAAAKKAARKAAKAQAAKRRRLTAKVLEGKMTITKAQKALGITPAKKGKPKKTAAVVAKAAVAPALDQATLKAAITEATAPLLERVAAQDKAARKMRKTLNAIASQPDTSNAPMRGVAMAPGVTKTSAAAQPTLQARGELAQENLLRLHMDTWRNDPDPGAREVAWAEINKMIGTTPMTAKQT